LLLTVSREGPFRLLPRVRHVAGVQQQLHPITTKGKTPMRPKLEIEHQQNDSFILKVTANGKYWEVDVRIDPDPDGGIDVDMSRDGISCTGCEFGWDDKHDNEPQ